jgi:hypothetical protein
MAINTNGILTITSQWTQVSTDPTNTNNVITDAGQLAYQRTYNSGNVSGTVNQVYHKLATLASGGTGNFDLSGLSQDFLGNSVSKAFLTVSSLTIKNHSVVSGYDININVNSVSGFRQAFGYPTGSIVLRPLSALHINSAMQEYPVNSGSKQIQLVDMGSGATYELVLFGHTG